MILQLLSSSEVAPSDTAFSTLECVLAHVYVLPCAQPSSGDELSGFSVAVPVDAGHAVAAAAAEDVYVALLPLHPSRKRKCFDSAQSLPGALASVCVCVCARARLCVCVYLCVRVCVRQYLCV